MQRAGSNCILNMKLHYVYVFFTMHCTNGLMTLKWKIFQKWKRTETRKKSGIEMDLAVFFQIPNISLFLGGGAGGGVGLCIILTSYRIGHFLVPFDNG